MMLTGPRNDLHHWLLQAAAPEILAKARGEGEAAPAIVTYSRKVFIPLTKLCRDVCSYCTFAQTPRRAGAAYLSIEEVLEIARAGARAGCREALFTLGDKPEARYAAARTALAEMGCATTVDYLERAAGAVLETTGLLPHLNAGVLTLDEYRRLRPVAASMGLMLESASERLCGPGQPHFGSPDKHPAVRLRSIAAAGEAGVPFTTGLLIGIGETRAERLQSLFALRDLHDRHGHIQEVIIQNFRAKPGTRMANSPEPTLDELIWTIAAARLIMGPEVAVQSPPNLNPGRTAALLAAGLDDWGGISPVTIDHVNPEAPWPQLDQLAAECAAAGRVLVERLTIYPRHIARPARWLDPAMARAVIAQADSTGLARDCDWSPGQSSPAPVATLVRSPTRAARTSLDALIGRAASGGSLQEHEIVRLFDARGPAAQDVLAAADELRASRQGDTVTFVVNRNINYTNICSFSCAFCAFAKTKAGAGLRDAPYDLAVEEVAARAVEAWERGATEVCLQGGIHPRYTGKTYLDIVRAVKAAVPDMHVHAFSPLEIHQGAQTLGVSVTDLLLQLKDAGLGSLPGTAAEILDDEVRALICPDKVSTEQWLDVVAAAHRIGLPTTSTIMFGHLERPVHWARHLLILRRQQYATGGFTEFVPLPFVHMNSPLFNRGLARKGPTWRETLLMHAVSRIVLHGAINSIQVSWVKLGAEGAAACLSAGANDLGGVLMNESISRAAGAQHGQEMSASGMRQMALAAGRSLRRRTTLYRLVNDPPIAGAPAPNGPSPRDMRNEDAILL